MRRTRRAALALAAAAVFAAATPSTAVRADAPVTVRVGATGNDTAAEVYYADELGMFKRRGLAVEIQNLRNGAAEAAAVAGGALDIGEQNVVSMSHAHVRGLPFKFIAPAGQYVASSSTTSLVVAKSSPIRGGGDLRGKTIAVNALSDLTQIGAAAWIDKHGGDARTLRFIEIPAGEIGAAVGRGTVDAGVIPEPSLTAALDVGRVRVLGQPYDAIGDRFAINAWFATESWISQNPAVARKFAAAIAEAARWANAHRAESAKILDKHSSADAGVVARMRRASYAERLDPKAMQIVIDAAVRYQGLARSFDAAELIDAL